MVKKKLDQVVYEHLIKQIESGRLLQREHVTEQGVADELSISRTPVRRAFERLVEEGYLETIENVGVRVKVQTLDSKGFQDRLNLIERLVNQYLFDLEKQEFAFKSEPLASQLEMLGKKVETDGDAFEKLELEYWYSLIQYIDNDYIKYTVLKVLNDILCDDGLVCKIMKNSRSLKIKHFTEVADFLKENQYTKARREIRILFNQLKLHVIEQYYEY